MENRLEETRSGKQTLVRKLLHSPREDRSADLIRVMTVGMEHVDTSKRDSEFVAPSAEGAEKTGRIKGNFYFFPLKSMSVWKAHL